MFAANGETLGEIETRRGIFQGDSLSPLVCCCKDTFDIGIEFGLDKCAVLTMKAGMKADWH